MKRKLFAAMAVAAALVLSACGGSSNAGDLPSKVRIAFQVIPNGAPIVKNQKWLEDTLGVPVEFTEFSSGADVNAAMASGSVDIGLIGSNPATIGIATSLGYKIVWIYDIIGAAEALVAKPGITSMDQLVGKKVATPFGSTSHYSLLKALELANVDPNSVEIVDMQPQDALAAWTRGDIDAAYLWNPNLAEMIKSGGKVLTSSADLSAAGFPTADLGIVSTKFANAYPDLVKKWLVQEDRAVKLYRSDPAGAAKIVAKEFNLSEADAADQMSQLVWLTGAEQADAKYLGTAGNPGALVDMLVATGKFLVTQGKLASEPALDALQKGVDGQYLPTS